MFRASFSSRFYMCSDRTSSRWTYGRRPSQLSKFLFCEVTILGKFLWTTAGSTSISRILLIDLEAFLIYWLKTILQVQLARRIKPYEPLQSNEIPKGGCLLRSRISDGMSPNHHVTCWPLNSLSFLAIYLPNTQKERDWFIGLHIFYCRNKKCSLRLKKSKVLFNIKSIG